MPDKTLQLNKLTSRYALKARINPENANAAVAVVQRLTKLPRLLAGGEIEGRLYPYEALATISAPKFPG
jgi:hypothetical protein